MSYQATYQADTRVQIPGSRLHTGSRTRTLHADTGRDGVSERRGESERQGARATRGPSDGVRAAGRLARSAPPLARSAGTRPALHVQARARDPRPPSRSGARMKEPPASPPPLCRGSVRERVTDER